jgi:5-methylcytosine-specific restriction endonuclease McrA
MRAKMCGARRRAKLRQLLERGGRFCWLCNSPIRTHQKATIDHVVPRALGGTHDISNLRLAHHHCNQQRKDGPPPVLILTERMRLEEAA